MYAFIMYERDPEIKFGYTIIYKEGVHLLKLFQST